MIQPLDIKEYRNVYEAGKVECASTEEMRPLEEIIGQERALRALRFGLEIREAGFNVYAAGAQGTGRVRAVRSFLDELAKAKPPRASDWVYVHNFENQYEPNAVALPAGRGTEFREDVKRFIEGGRGRRFPGRSRAKSMPNGGTRRSSRSRGGTGRISSPGSTSAPRRRGSSSR
ncbi:AAA family ATPase [Methanoculleus chikugoensis]|uniref:Lon-like protease helical domain-containing protein n=1 Tax=Methanoculleus chikugoensis TaxID=118126 RepID=UPI000B0ED4BD|nr:Lon-like protease helical domain-containing protein [Methanoculleus chikugoensis]